MVLMKLFHNTSDLVVGTCYLISSAIFKRHSQTLRLKRDESRIGRDTNDGVGYPIFYPYIPMLSSFTRDSFSSLWNIEDLFTKSLSCLLIKVKDHWVSHAISTNPLFYKKK